MIFKNFLRERSVEMDHLREHVNDNNCLDLTSKKKARERSVKIDQWRELVIYSYCIYFISKKKASKSVRRVMGIYLTPVFTLSPKGWTVLSW